MMAINKDRLLKLAEHLERGELGHERFDFGIYNGDRDEGFNWHYVPGRCGTNGCAIGECPILFPTEWYFEPTSGMPLTWRDDHSHIELESMTQSTRMDWYAHCSMLSAESFFGLNMEAARHLFLPMAQKPELFGGKKLLSCASRLEVANNIRAFLGLAEREEGKP